MVVGNEEVKLYNTAKGYPIFSSDSKRCAVMIRDNNGWMVFDSEEETSKSYLNVKALQFSPDSTRIGYLAQLKDKEWVAVIDHQEGLPYSDIKWLIFSRDGQHVAYCVQNGEKEFVVVDGKEIFQCDSVIPKSLHYEQKLYFQAISGKKSYVVIDGQPKKHYDKIGFVKLNPVNGVTKTNIYNAYSKINLDYIYCHHYSMEL